MTPDEIRKLLGGYATGTLSDEERNVLFSAALEDQELFDALADEEVLRELLAEPHTRQTLIEELQRQSVLNPSPLEDKRVPLEFAAHAMSPPPHPASAEIRNLAGTFRARTWDRFTPSQLAVAGGLAIILLVAGGILYKSLRSPGGATVAPVNLAMSRAPERNQYAVGEPDAARSSAPPARGEKPAPRPIPRTATPPALDSPKEADRQLADARVSGARQAEERPPEANGVALGRDSQRNEDNRAAVPPAATRDAPESGEKAEKETVNADKAREQLNQAVRQQAAQARSAEPASPESPAPPVPPASGRSALVTPAQIVSSGLRTAPVQKTASRASQSSPIDAKVTDINGTIVSVNVGSNIGLKAGDVVEIVRDNRVIATSKLSQVGATFSVGPVERASNSADTPRTGDAVRRAVASQPQR